LLYCIEPLNKLILAVKHALDILGGEEHCTSELRNLLLTDGGFTGSHLQQLVSLLSRGLLLD